MRELGALPPCYSRKDRRTKSLDPVTTRYVASMFEAVGTDTVATLEVHNPAAFENAFRCRTVTLTAAPIPLLPSLPPRHLRTPSFSANLENAPPVAAFPAPCLRLC